MKRNLAFIALALLGLASACAIGGEEQNDSVSLSDIASDASLNSGAFSSEPASETDTPKNANCLKLISSLEELKACERVVMVGKDGSNYYGYTDVALESYPWLHIIGESLTAIPGHDDLLELSFSIKELVLTFSNDKVGVNVGGNYLWAGMRTGSDSQLHASIELQSEATYLNLDDFGNGDFRLYSDDGAYVGYCDGSFCGVSSSDKENAVVSFYSYYYEESLESSSSLDPIASSDANEHWLALDLSKRGNAFRADLQKLIKGYKTRTTSYSKCLSIGQAAASDPNDSSKFVPFYHAPSGTQDGVLTSEGAQSVSGDCCNREHTWPNSRGCGKSGPGCDPFIIRPTLTSENSSRGNSFYGNSSSNEWDPSSCGYEYARGEAARITLYAATAYYGTCGSGGSSEGNEPMELSNNPNDDADKHTMGTLRTLLEWNEKYAPTAMEIQINEYLCKNGYGRNPFVDEPRFASYIWDSNGIRA